MVSREKVLESINGAAITGVFLGGPVTSPIPRQKGRITAVAGAVVIFAAKSPLAVQVSTAGVQSPSVSERRYSTEGVTSSSARKSHTKRSSPVDRKV